MFFLWAAGGMAVLAICAAGFGLVTAQYLKRELVEVFYEMKRRRRLGDEAFEDKVGPHILREVRWYMQISMFSGAMALAAAFAVLYTTKN